MSCVRLKVAGFGFVKEGAGGWNLFLIIVKVNYVLVVAVPSKKWPATITCSVR